MKNGPKTLLYDLLMEAGIGSICGKLYQGATGSSLISHVRSVAPLVSKAAIKATHIYPYPEKAGMIWRIR